MKKILMLTYDNFDDGEVLYPYYRMLEAGFEVDIASMEKRVIHAKHFFSVEANLLLEEVDSTLYDGLILPGGTAPEKLRQRREALDIVRYFDENGLPIASICHGQQILISAGVICGRHCTCYPGIRDDVVNAGGLYENSRVVIDTSKPSVLVTSRRPEDLPYFMREFVARL